MCDCTIKALHPHAIFWVHLASLPSLHEGLLSGVEKERVSPTPALPSIWLEVGVESPRVPHRRLANVPIMCVSSVGRTTHLLLLACYASLGRLFFLPLETLPRKEYVATSDASVL